jgi:methylmalonyl-CoA mutase cobalamin-binding subunit
MEKRSKGTVIIGGTESDTHVVSLYLAAIMLEEHGYRVINRTCQNPTADLMADAGEEVEVLAYVVCNQNGHALEDLRDLRLFKSRATPIILGGHYTLGCHNKLAQQSELRAVGVDLFVESLGDLIPLLDQIAAAKAAQGNWQSCLREAQAPNQIAAAKAAQSDWLGWLTEAQGGAA